MHHRAYQIDIGRQVETPEFVMADIPRHAAWGYDTLVLYVEDAFRFPSHPEFAQPCAWTAAQMRQVTACATRVGMTVIPVVPALGHTAYFLKHPKYRSLGERRETQGSDGTPVVSGQVCPSLDDTYDFLLELFRDIAPFCTAGYLHVSLDESFDLGVCSLCRRRVERGGAAALFIEHLQRLHGLVKSLGLRMAVWGDMFYYFPAAIRGVPKDVAVFDWYYYPFARRPRVELFNFREVPSAERLKAAGLEVWACPNNGPFFCEIAPPFADRLRNIRSWWDYGRRTGCDALCITSWSPNYAAAELNTVVNAAAADLWLSPRRLPVDTMVRNGVRRLYGPAGDAALPAIRLMDRHPLVGYWRYQIVRAPLTKTATLESPSRLEPVVRAFAQASTDAAARRAPPAIVDTCRIREYYAARQRLAGAGSRLLFEARTAWQRGNPRGVRARVGRIAAWTAECAAAAKTALAATRRLWKRSRYASDPNRLAELLAGDLMALAELRRFLRTSQSRPAQVMAGCGLLAARQILVKVRNRRPCLQGMRVAVSTDGAAYRDLHTLYLLEFSVDAGQPETRFVHWHSVPIPDDIPADRPLQVRLSAVGLGEADFSSVALLDGGRRRRPERVLDRAGRTLHADALVSGGWATLGSRAPARGFPPPARFSEDHHVTVVFPSR